MLSVMFRYIRIAPIQRMISDFFSGDYNGCKTTRNVFTNVPQLSSELEMANYIIKSLNSSEEFSGTGMTCFAQPRDHKKITTICGVATAPNEGQKGLTWISVEFLIACGRGSAGEDPFCSLSQNGEVATDKHREVLGEIISQVELIFKYQQRHFVFIVLLTAHYGRIVRFDRSGIIASEKIDYEIDGSRLTEFITRYASLSAAKRGHDPTASRISPTDPLLEELKEHGAAAAEMDPEDHVQKLFNQSLDEKWPWWKLELHDEESNKTKWFAVGKPHFYAGGVLGRGTRGYVAMPLDDEGEEIDSKAAFVYLKDAWRVDHEGMEMEGTILKALNAAKVQYVPTLLYHGDLGQSTESYDRWPDYHEGKTRETCPLKSHQHYRLVVAEVGKPLSEFTNSIELVWALICCITAHEQACAAGYIHRDISAGNILLYRDGTGHWAGLLNDWELSKECKGGKTQAGGRQLDRTGTWQFMSVHALLKNFKTIEIPDDLESFFHVLVYFAVRFLPHNLADRLVGKFLCYYFDDYTDGDSGFTCGPVKYMAIKRGVIDLTLITGSGDDAESNKEEPLVFFQPQFASPEDSKDDDDEMTEDVARATHPIGDLISDILRAFQAFYAKDAVQKPKPKALGNTALSRLPPSAIAAMAADLVNTQDEAADDAAAPGADSESTSAQPVPTPAPKLEEKIETHAAMRKLMWSHFRREGWPDADKGDDKKPIGGYVPAKENTIVGSAILTGSKRGAQDGGGSTSKRVRSRAA